MLLFGGALLSSLNISRPFPDSISNVKGNDETGSMQPVSIVKHTFSVVASLLLLVITVLLHSGGKSPVTTQNITFLTFYNFTSL